MVAGASCQPRRQPRWLTPVAIFVLSFVLHYGTLRGGFVWDDRLAVVANRDIRTDSPWADMWHHDFWGQKMAGAGSHKSFRPLTTLTFRLSNVIAEKMSAEEQYIVSASSQQATESSATPAAKEHVPTKTVDVARGAGPKHADAAGFHLFNVVVHAAACSSSVWIFRAVFPGQELPAVVASLLFTVHPVHVEAVAPIVGRADLLCGLLSMIALALTITTTGGQLSITDTDTDTDTDRAGNSLSVAAPDPPGQVAPVAPACNVPEKAMTTPPPVAQGAKMDHVSWNEVGAEENKINHRALGRGKTARRKRKAAGKSSSSPSVAAMVHSSPRKLGAPVVQAWKDTGPGMARFVAALVFAVGATLCKEIGITVFVLMAGGEVVRFFEESDQRRRREQRQRRRRPRQSNVSTVAPHGALQNQMVVLQPWWRRFVVQAPVAAVARIASALTCAALLVVLHVRLRQGAGVREWGVLENDISILASRKERALSYAFTHAVYAYKLLWPTKLCYDWGFSCLPHVTSLADPANIAPLTLYGSVLVSAALAVVRCDTAVMWGLALVVVPFLPASNMFFPVGAVVAERLLYLPSLGACILAGGMLRQRGSNQTREIFATPGSSPGGESNSVRSNKSLASNLETQKNLVEVVFSDDPVEQQQETDESRAAAAAAASPGGKKKEASVAFGSPDSKKKRQDLRTMPNRPTTSSVSSPSSSETKRAPACGRSGVFSPTGRQGAEKTKRLPVVLGCRRSPQLPPTRYTMVLIVLLSWAALFGVGTLQRGKDWNSERALFESALKVCPDGIKTLNNMAANMLNKEEAGRAEVLLLRAVELHPGYAFAWFNLGMSRRILGDHVGAAVALERSMELEPWNTMTMVSLGQVNLDRTLKALQTPFVSAGQGDNVETKIDGTNQDASTGPSSPESLLSRAELYTDQALAAGSGLPLARLVKGQVLALRGRHQNAAEFFQSYIDISRHLLSGSASSSSVGRLEASLATSDAVVDLASAYNFLGLALRDSGLDVMATKKAFLAGLSLAPENLALLVNGGVAHQAAGDIDGAKILYHRALSVQPSSPELLNNLGWLEEASGGGSRASLETSAGLYVRALGLMGEGSPAPARAQVELNLTNVRKRLNLLDDADGHV